MRPTSEEQRQFLIQVCFSKGGTTFDGLVSRAYRDMNRTLRGIGKLDPDIKERVLAEAKACIAAGFDGLKNKVSPKEPVAVRAEFDAWHSDSCDTLIECYAGLLGGISPIRMTHGQAQKWINMTVKYCWAFGGSELDRLVPWYPAAHVPVDEVILRAAVAEKIVGECPVSVWSKWDDPDAYQAFQERWRVAAWARGRTPMELEFELWPKHRRGSNASAEQS